ncbi:hypothetical protein G7Y89_g4661 [Cudoniella acicularis]|uniref:Formamidopyrimidine-DNA glycosylase catalytic domain-containing protein n=1 Tax=Cudoniella acicularis TaxID=354080 RepID=A0A8H4RR65_9HELO|nr:hypothetical protein G7Y89_g4661 [Cudoniella acicularis]
MPEIAEVARVVHYLRKSLVGKTLAVVKAQDDANVFGKVGTTGAEVQKSLTGKKVLDAASQGKYFWHVDTPRSSNPILIPDRLIMSSPPHPVFHFGMTGWCYIRGEKTIHYRPENITEREEWPQLVWKLLLETSGEPKVEVAFADSRRFGRIRLVDCAGEDIRKTTPLKENGPDPVIDKDILTVEWLEKKLKSKRVPVKALLLDQANISGIGNWVGDEILYNAKLHPEQYSNTFNSDQVKQLHKSIHYVCQTAVDLLADSSKFPDDWLFNHRWGKGKKDSPTTLPNGAKITHLTVGGRTSCVVPSIQKKTGAVAGDIKKDPDNEGGDENSEVMNGSKAKQSQSKKRKAGADEIENDVGIDSKYDDSETASHETKGKPKKSKPNPKVKSQPKSSKPSAKEEVESGEEEPEELPAEVKVNSNKVKATSKGKASKKADLEAIVGGRRHSGRISRAQD